MTHNPPIADDLLIPVECPKCGEKFTKPFGWLKARDGFTCPGICGAHIWYHNETLIYDAEEFSRVRKIGLRITMPGK